MSAAQIPAESKTVKKRKADVAVNNDSASAASDPQPVSTAAANINGVESSNDSPYIKELSR